ncbi:MAG: hypothetical protein HQL12_06975 [Candidatus Omnitrophica bacterium]|nr:hypothetical protein [Candidatus Omnitrophota bacterium]
MFPQFKKLNNESGIVLFIVLMTAMIIMIFCLGILTQSMNEINYAQQQVDQISTDELAKGLWWNAYSSGMNGIVPSGSVNIAGRSYQIVIGSPVTDATGINSYNVVVNYDTFQ